MVNGAANSTFGTSTSINGEGESLKNLNNDSIELQPTEDMSEEDETPLPLEQVVENTEELNPSVILSISDLENMLKDPNLPQAERKKLKKKLKKKRQKERKKLNTSTDVDVDPLDSEDIVPNSEDNVTDSIETTEKEQVSKNKQLEALRSIKLMDKQVFSKSTNENSVQTPASSNVEETETNNDQPNKEKFVPSLPPAERNLMEARSSKERELEALRNRNLAGKQTKQLKKEINKNIQLQQQQQQQEGNMEWRKIGHSIEPIPTTVTVMSPGFEQLAIDQNKNRRESMEKERETLLQYQQHPESLKKDSKYLFEMDFVFGLVSGEKDKAPDKYTATKAASKIVPNMLTTKKTIYYDPRYPPKVSSVEKDPDFSKEGQVRYMVKGKVPVLPKKGSPKGRKKRSKNRKSSSPSSESSPANTASPASQNSNITGDISSGNRDQESIPSSDLQTPSSDGSSPKEKFNFASPSNNKVETPIDHMIEVNENLPINGDDDTAAAMKMNEIKVKGATVEDKKPSEAKYENLKSSKAMELEAIRQRGVAQKKNEDFEKLQEQSARDKAAYEAEKQDLERRKMSTSEYTYSGVGILPHDDVYLQQNKQNKDDRDKRRSTILEYQQLGKVQNDAPSHDLDIQRQRRYEKIFQRRSKGKVENKISTRDQELEALRQRPTGKAEFEERPSQAKYAKLKSSKATELEALRQRAVTKKTNKEFTKMEEQSALDRAAYEAEQQDLENRRSSTSTYQFSGNKVMNPHDNVYLQQNKQKREELEKKQRTILGYQRKSNTGRSGFLGFGLLFKESGKKVRGKLMKSQKSQWKEDHINAINQVESSTEIQTESNDKPLVKSKRLQEIEALRQQGLAKRGSEQFVELQRVRNEDKAAHDAAARDLEQRKANTSEYKYIGTKEISPVDAVYLDHHRWKKDTQKQDREALGIYDKPPEHTIGKDSEPQDDVMYTNEEGYKAWEHGDEAPIGDIKRIRSNDDPVGDIEEGAKSKCACSIM